MDLHQRFWSKVDVSGMCWLWTASLFKSGYGKFRVGSKTRRAHRVCYELTCGELSDAVMVLHSCDNRRCVRPSHLFIGDAQANTDDMKSKGRMASGPASFPDRSRTNNPAAKLNDDKVAQAKEWLAQSVSQRDVAKRLNVSQRTIWRIANGKGWK